MDFLRACANDLDAGAPATEVMERMRARFTTVRCMNVKTCLVRQMCTPTPEYVAAVETLLHTLSEGGDDDLAARVRQALETPRGRGGEADVRAVLQTLPPRLPQNVRDLKVTRAEMIECKRLGAQCTVAKNRRRRRVTGVWLLKEARNLVAFPHTAPSVEMLALAIMAVAGRRTCETLNGHSTFVVHAPYALQFNGQAKRRRRSSDPDDAYVMPTLAPAADVVAAVDELRRRQHGVLRTNKETSLRYQSTLGRHLSAHEPWASCGRVHALRGIYVCMALRLFEWGDASDAYVAMCILGHASLEESLAYTAYHVGDDVRKEVHLGEGHFSSRDIITHE